MATSTQKIDDSVRSNQDIHASTADSNQNTVQQSYMNAREYAQALRQWMFHYHMSKSNAMHLFASNFAIQMQQVAYFSNLGSANLLCASNFSEQTRTRPDPYAGRRPNAPGRPDPIRNPFNLNGQQTPINSNTPLTDLRSHGVIFKVPTFWKRVAAEMIDFAFLFYLKLMISICLVTEFSLDLSFINGEDFIDSLNDLDYDKAFAITFEIIALEIINRALITIFETFCIWRTPGRGRGRAIGATPGKKLMGLRVVSCDSVHTLDNNRVLVMPAGNINLKNAFLRSVIKNFTIAFFLPACLTLFFFKHNRTAYDVIAHTIVVEDLA